MNADDRPEDREHRLIADELELTVVPKSASLSGRVIGGDEAAVSSYVVVLLSASAGAAGKGRRTVTLARPDNTGRYLFSHQTAGPYVLFVLADPEPGDIDLLVDASKRDSSDGVPVMLEPDSDATLDLRIRSRSDGAIATRSRAACLAWGLVPGVLLALGFAVLIRHCLFGVTSYDTVSFAVVPVGLVLVGVVASILPLIRVTRTTPAHLVREL